MTLTIITLLLSLPLLGQAPPSSGPGVQISATNIPYHGPNQALYTSANVFSLSAASVYPDGTQGDWRHWVATAKDPVTIQSQDIQLRKQTATQQISDITDTGAGVTGPTNNFFYSNMFLAWDFADNDLSTVDFTGHYYDMSANGAAYNRVLGSSGVRLQCAAGGTLIAGCGRTFTVTPHKTGAQSIYVFTRTEGINGSISVTVGGSTTSYNLPAPGSAGTDEEQVTIGINPSVADTSYTVALNAQSVQPGASIGYISVMAAALGGATPGNVDSNTLLNGTAYLETPSNSFGTRVTQAIPSVRIPAATTSVTLCISPGNPSGCMSSTLANYIATAVGGTDIHLPPGFVSIDQIKLPARAENGWVSVICDGAHNVFGERAQPIDYPGGSSSPGKISYSGGDGVIVNDRNNATMALRAAHHYYFKGCEITDDRTLLNYGVDTSYYLVWFDPGQSATAAAIPHDIVFQGVYAHRHPSMVNTINGLKLDVAGAAVYDSYISDIVGPTKGNESHAITLRTSPGPLTVWNTYLEAATENVLLGGAPGQPFVVPQDIDFQRNYFAKNPYWCTFPAGIDTKNGLEFKTGRHVTVSGNVFETICGASQTGQGIFVRNPTSWGMQSTSNYLIENNLIRHAGAGIAIEGTDLSMLGGLNHGTVYDATAPYALTPQHFDIKISNNSIEDLSWARYTTHGFSETACLSISGLPTNFIVDRNSCDWNAIDYTNNHYKNYAVSVDAQSTLIFADQINGCQGHARAAPLAANNGWIFTNNILSGELGMSCVDGPQMFPEARMGSFTNNLFYNIRMIGTNPFPDFVLTGTGNTHTSVNTAPVVRGRGVDKSLMPDECLVKTGNRSDISCTPGN